MAYYTLVTRDGLDEPFAPQFGDYQRQVVEMERRDCYAEYGRRDYRIIRTEAAHQFRIEAAVVALNQWEG